MHVTEQVEVWGLLYHELGFSFFKFFLTQLSLFVEFLLQLGSILFNFGGLRLLGGSLWYALGLSNVYFPKHIVSFVAWWWNLFLTVKRIRSMLSLLINCLYFKIRLPQIPSILLHSCFALRQQVFEAKFRFVAFSFFKVCRVSDIVLLIGVGFSIVTRVIIA